MPINISKTPGAIENVLIGANCLKQEIEIYIALFNELCDIIAWSYEEMPGIDPRIVEHEIKTYPNVKLVQHKLFSVNPKKAPTIKAKIENFLNGSLFIQFH